VRRKPDARALLYERIRTSPPKFVHVTGVPYSAELEPDNGHPSSRLWLTLEAPPYGRLRATINTASLLNHEAGFDGRVRVAVQDTPWDQKPETGLKEVEALSYAALEAVEPVPFAEQDAGDFGATLLAKAKQAVRAEVWGDLYATDHLGIRQIHSRRASSAVKDDVVGRDGALRLYYPDNRSELFLFKFHGQP
jgi:hypothetical protein